MRSYLVRAVGIRSLVARAAFAALVVTTGCIEISAPTPVNAVSVFVPTASLRKGESMQAVGIPVSATGALISGRTITWSSSNADIASVTPAGVVTAVGVGSVEIRATAEGQTGKATLVVVQ